MLVLGLSGEFGCRLVGLVSRGVDLSAVVCLLYDGGTKGRWCPTPRCFGAVVGRLLKSSSPILVRID